MNLAKISINGKDHSLLFGYTCYKLFIVRCFKFKDTFLNESFELTRLGIANLFNCAYLDYCYDKGIDPELSYNDIFEWLDDLYKDEPGQQIIADLLKVWANSKAGQKLKEESEEGEKKSLNGTMSPALTN